ncbi:MAG: TetR/AcrR family transcriptional regulator [Alistipes sp.]
MTKNEALQAGVKLAKSIGLINVSRSGLCAELGIHNSAWPSTIGCSFTEFFDELKDLVPASTHLITKKRVNPELRKDHVLNVALALSEVEGYSKVTRLQVADAAGVSTGTVSKHFGTMDQLRNDVVRRAVKTKNLKVIAQAIAAGDRHVKKIDVDLKAEALRCLI